jgi:hypothetical protein
MVSTDGGHVMFFRFTKAIIHLALLTSKLVLGFQASVIIMNDIANNETTPPPFPGCETSASNTWCNSVWAENNNYQPPLDSDGLQNCYLSNNCCPHSASTTQFSQCPNYNIYRGVGAGLTLTGLVLLCLGGDHSIRKQILRFFGSVLSGGGVGALLGTTMGASSDDPASNVAIYTGVMATAGGLIGVMLWSGHVMRTGPGHGVVVPAPIAGAAPPAPAQPRCTIL